MDERRIVADMFSGDPATREKAMHEAADLIAAQRREETRLTDIEKKLKQELDEAKKTVEEQRQRIQYFESNGIMARGVYLAAALKFGTEVAPA